MEAEGEPEEEIRFQIVQEILDDFPQLRERVKEYLSGLEEVS
jgi:hypothetical protein